MRMAFSQMKVVFIPYCWFYVDIVWYSREMEGKYMISQVVANQNIHINELIICCKLIDIANLNIVKNSVVNNNKY
jgi:hypothetical protein